NCLRIGAATSATRCNRPVPRPVRRALSLLLSLPGSIERADRVAYRARARACRRTDAACLLGTQPLYQRIASPLQIEARGRDRGVGGSRSGPARQTFADYWSFREPVCATLV